MGLRIDEEIISIIPVYLFLINGFLHVTMPWARI